MVDRGHGAVLVREVTMTRGSDQWAVQFCVVLTLTLSGAAIAELNDTGASKCWSDSAMATTGVETDSGTHPRQDCRYGRDAAATAGVLPKVGGGSAGFDFSKIANDGSVLSESTVLGNGDKDWACTRDNVTGLVWEVKTTSGLRHYLHTYSVLRSDGVGTASAGACESIGRCDTLKFVQDVNASRLCGASDWRVPSVTELEGIVSHESANFVDLTYFPNSSVGSYSPYLTSSAHAYTYSSTALWFVDFTAGRTSFDPDVTGKVASVRLVRDGR